MAGPETANNAASGGAFIPLLALGLPANALMAVLLAAFMIHGLQPGPMFLNENPLFFWTIIASMYVGNIILLVLNLPLIAIWVQMLKIPFSKLFPIILIVCVIGSYSENFNLGDVVVMAGFGVFGYIARKLNYNGAPLIFGVVLSPLFEVSFRQSLLMSEGSVFIFFRRPISLFLLVVAFLIISFPFIKSSVRKMFRKFF